MHFAIQSESKVSEKQSSIHYRYVQVWAGCVPAGLDQPHMETPGKFWTLFKCPSFSCPLFTSFSQACIGEPPVHRDFHSATAIGLKYSYFSVLYAFGFTFTGYVSWPLLTRLPDVHLWGAERPDWWSVASQHGAWLLQQQGQTQICNRLNVLRCYYCWSYMNKAKLCYRCATLTQPHLHGTTPA